MPAWATVLVSLGGGVIGIAGTLLGVQLQHKHAQDERREAERTRFRERGAAILGPIGTLLSDADPTRLGLNAGPHSREVLADLWTRWLTLRDELVTYGAGHPDGEFAPATQRLMVAVSNSVTSGRFLVDDVLNPTGGGHDMLAVARNDHELAQELLKVVTAAARGAVAGDDLAAAAAELEQKAKAERPAFARVPHHENRQGG